MSTVQKYEDVSQHVMNINLTITELQIALDTVDINSSWCEALGVPGKLVKLKDQIEQFCSSRPESNNQKQGNDLVLKENMVKVVAAKAKEREANQNKDKENARDPETPIAVPSEEQRILQQEKELSVLKDYKIRFKMRCSIMRRIVKEIEGDKWDVNRIAAIKFIKEFDCKLCMMNLKTPYDVIRHVMGKCHREKLENERRTDLMWDLIEDVDGTTSNIGLANEDSQVDHVHFKFHCELCKKGMNGPITVMDHIHGSIHQDKIKVEV